MAIFPDDYPYIAPDGADLALLADVSNANLNGKATIEDFTKAWLAASTSDFLPEWATNLYQTPTEKAKLAWIQPWAQVNQVNSVQWTQGNVTLNLDMIPNWLSRKAGDAVFNTTKDVNLATAYSHSQINPWNPHGTTPAMIWLWNVTNDEQLSTTAGNFSNLAEKPDTQQHLEDLFVIQDSSDNNNIKSVKNQTMLIWYASMIQERWPSINYYDYTFTSSTTYNIMSIVTVGANIYKCIVAHQSSASFASDLANGYWQIIWGWGWGGGNQLTAWNWSPVGSGVNPWDIYVDLLTGDLYYWDWSSRQWPINWWWWGGNVISDSIPATDRSVPVYNWTSWTHIVESPVTIDGSGNVDWINDIDVDWTATFNWDVNFNQSNITYNQTTENYIGNETLIACQVWPLAFATPYTASIGTQLTKVQITFDNWVDPADVKTTSTLLNWVSQTLNFVCGTDTGSVQISWLAGDITVTILTGTPAFFTLNSICDYNWYAVNNYTDKIEVYDNVTQELTNVVINNDNTVVNWNIINNANNTYTGENTFEGDTTINNLTVENINISGSVVWANEAHIEHFTATASQTVFTLANTPASNNFVWVSLNNGQYAKQLISLDYTVSGNVVTLVNPATAGDVISVQYIESLGTPIANFVQAKKLTWVSRPAGGGSSTFTFSDPDVVSWSIIRGWTITSGTQVGFWEFNLSVPWHITINSTASETWTIVFNISFDL